MCSGVFLANHQPGAGHRDPDAQLPVLAGPAQLTHTCLAGGQHCSVDCVSLKCPYLGRLGGSGVERLPLAQVMIPGSWDRVPHRGPRREPASPSACVSGPLGLGFGKHPHREATFLLWAQGVAAPRSRVQPPGAAVASRSATSPPQETGFSYS